MIVAQDAVAPGSGSAGRVGCWLFCLTLVLGLHVAAVLMLLRSVQAPEPATSSPDTVMIDLAPASVTPVAAASAPPPAPPPEPAPFPSVPTPLPAVPALQEATPLPPPPVPLPLVRAARPRRPVRHAAAPPPQDEAPVASPSAPVAAASQVAPRNPAAVPNWQNQLLGRLQRVKRYPEAARDRSEQGVASIRFTIDRTGHVLSASLVRSSGSETLDEEALVMIHRADPLPPPPTEVDGSTVTLTVPVSFALQ